MDGLLIGRALVPISSVLLFLTSICRNYSGAPPSHTRDSHIEIRRKKDEPDAKSDELVEPWDMMRHFINNVLKRVHVKSHEVYLNSNLAKEVSGDLKVLMRINRTLFANDGSKFISSVRVLFLVIPYGFAMMTWGAILIMLHGTISVNVLYHLLGYPLLNQSSFSVRRPSEIYFKGHAVIATIIFILGLKFFAGIYSFSAFLWLFISGAMVAFYAYGLIIDGRTKYPSVKLNSECWQKFQLRWDYDGRDCISEHERVVIDEWLDKETTRSSKEFIVDIYDTRSMIYKLLYGGFIDNQEMVDILGLWKQKRMQDSSWFFVPPCFEEFTKEFDLDRHIDFLGFNLLLDICLQRLWFLTSTSLKNAKFLFVPLYSQFTFHLLVVDFETRRFREYNSGIRCSEVNNHVNTQFVFWRKYLSKRLSQPDIMQWQLEFVQNCPRHKLLSVDHTLFVLKIIERILDGLPVQFGQEDLERSRAHIASLVIQNAYPKALTGKVANRIKGFFDLKWYMRCLAKVIHWEDYQ